MCLIKVSADCITIGGYIIKRSASFTFINFIIYVPNGMYTIKCAHIVKELPIYFFKNIYAKYIYIK